jgi:hypothetical protein
MEPLRVARMRMIVRVFMLGCIKNGMGPGRDYIFEHQTPNTGT